MITADDAARITALRETVLKNIDIAVKEGAGSKSGEGALSIHLPDRFKYPEEEPYRIGLTLYVFGPSRRYEWCGATLAEAVAKAERDVAEWVAELLSPTEDTP